MPQNILELQNNLWSKVKSGNLSVNNKLNEKKIYIDSGCVAGVSAVLLAFAYINKRRKKKEQDLSDLYE